MPRLPAPPVTEKTMADRFFTDDHRKGVCRRCGLIMHDTEPSCWAGLFYHRAEPHQKRALACANNGKSLITEDRDLVPFLRKSRRRFLKRNGIRA
jgi:hypothetical protein